MTPMPLVARALALLSLAAMSAFAASDDAERAKLQFFENEVRPILAHRCYECHGDKKQKGELRLDHIDHILKGGASGAALARGDAEKSLLVSAIRYKDEDLQMPPDDQLPAQEIAVLEKWIQLGAPWPKTEVARDAKGPRDQHGFTAEDRAYWFFQPLARHPAPKAGQEWAANDIDRFIAAKLAEKGLSPAPEADRLELVRRVYFDVHGLPPTKAQIEAFVSDKSPDAYARLVDSLLASPRYGERWAQHWLDLVRYSESDGYRADAFRPEAWPYRDYVIKSFNSDKPYNQFVREQLAGDEIAPDQPEVFIGASYLRNPIYEWNQRDVRGQAELIVDDLTANAGEVFLGLSMGCARCHDHKFDPILQKDYYSLRAFFEPVLWPTDRVLATKAEKAAYDAQYAKWAAATAELRAERDKLVKPELDKAVTRAYNRFTEDLRGMIDKPVAQRTALENILGTMSNRQLEYEHERFDPNKALKTPEAKARYRDLEAELKKFDHLKPKPLMAAFIGTDAGPVAPVTKMKSKKGEREIEPAYLTLLDPNAPRIAPLPNSTGRRTALADWLVRPDNQLSTRVIVNRVWQYHFGRGIAGTPNDLGHLGERPTHPELLDFLAQRFVAGGWKLKSLHRDILLSATYRQTARHTSQQALLVDPENKFYWRHSPRRLDAEQARDAILAATGELDLKEGGPSVDANTSSRRSIYTIKKRNNQNELLKSLDAPPGFASTADRQRTSTPLQALLFMNGDWMIQRSRRLAAVAPSIPEAWQATLGRSPTAEEVKQAEEFMALRSSGKASADRKARSAVPIDLNAGVFHENTPQERLLVRDTPKEGDDFTIDAIITPESVDTGASVRVIASRWNGEKSSADAHGWSLGLTGAKSAMKPRNLLVQLVGEDENTDTTYETVPSGIHLELKRTYHITVRVSCSEHNVSFIVRDLSQPGAKPQTATVKHNVMAKLSHGQASLVIGGLTKRSAHQFDGRISAIRIIPGTLKEEGVDSDAAAWSAMGGTLYRATDELAKNFAWSGGASNAESSDPKVRALADLGHVLLNSNEFLYLH